MLEVRLNDVVTEWVGLRAATMTVGTADDRERRQNDIWIAACEQQTLWDDDGQ